MEIDLQTITQVIAQLGGAGGLMSLVVNLTQGYKQGVRDMRKDMQESKDKQWSDVANNVANTETGAWVHRVIVICAMYVILSPMIIPAFFDNIKVEWYYPTDYNFLFFSFDKLKCMVAGNPEAKKTIVVLPVAYSLATNVIGHYLVNRQFKRR